MANKYEKAPTDQGPTRQFSGIQSKDPIKDPPSTSTHGREGSNKIQGEKSRRKRRTRRARSCPYLFRDKEHCFKVLEGQVGKRLLNSSKDFLLQGLCFYDAGSRSFYTTKAGVNSPEDLEGLKIRVMNHQMSVEMVNAMGGSATPMAYGELYTALQQGVVDGAENNPPSFVSSNHYEVAKFYTLDEHTAIPDVLVIGTKYWDKLSEQEKGWITDAATRSVATQKQYWKDSVDECMKTIEAAGVQVIRPDKTLFSEKTQSILTDFANDPQMKALVDAIKSEL